MSRWLSWCARVAASLRARAGRRRRASAAGDGQAFERLTERVLRSLANNSLVLAGEGLGEPADLLGRLAVRIAEHDDPVWSFHTIPVHLSGVPEEGFFDAVADAVFAALAPELAGLEPEDCSRPPGDLGFRRLARNLHRVVDELGRGSSRRVKLVLLVDGIEQLNHYRPRINQKLRSLFMTGLGEHLVAVAAGGAIDRRWERDGSPWYNFFEEVDMGTEAPGS